MSVAMDPLPFAEDPALTAAGLAVTAARPTMRYGNPGRGYVQVPVAMLEESAETVLVVSMLARRLRASSGGLVDRVLQTHLAYELGWIGAEEAADHDPKNRAPKLRAAVNRVSSWVREAASTSWMDVQYAYDVRRQRTTARYQLWGRPSADNQVEYVEAPADLFDLVAEGNIDKNGFLAFLRWRCMMGAATSTNSSVPQYAERWKVSEATARRHRKALLNAEALIEVAVPGAPSVTALPAGMVRTGCRSDGVVRSREAGLADTRKRPVHGSCSSVPDVVPNPVSVSPSAVADVQEVSRETTTAASPNQDRDSFQADFSSRAKPRRQASASSVALAGRVLTRFRADLVACEPRFRRAIIRRTAVFLDDGYGAEAIVRAANDLTIGIVDGNHSEAFRQALASLASDVLAGACKCCGRYREDGHHSACEQAGTESAAWFDEITARECCVMCDEDGRRREDLPIPVVVCDDCWDRQHEVDAVDAGGSSHPAGDDLDAAVQLNRPHAAASQQSCRRQVLGASAWWIPLRQGQQRKRSGRSVAGRCAHSQGLYGLVWRSRGRPVGPSCRRVGRQLHCDVDRSVERGRWREFARLGVP
jgi:hypothetical protein